MANGNRMAGPVKKQWGFLAYIAGDNNLSDAGLEDVRELCAEGASDQVHVGVEIDTYGEHTGSIRYEITEVDWTGVGHRTVIERLRDKDTGDPETLRSFLKWGLKRYPADNYIVVVWGHGTGFRSVRRDIGYDDFGSSLDMPEIEDVLKRSGIGPRNKIAILGFDSCLMNMLEIANHFRDRVEILVGSQQTEPGDGWPYDRVLNAMKKTANATDMSKKIVREYIKDYRKRGIFNVTHSAVDIAQTDRAIKALGRLGELLARNVATYRNDLKRIRMVSQTFEMADYVDLIHLAELISERIDKESIRNAAKKVKEATSSCIIEPGKLGGAVKDANGLSVWFPAYQILYYDYRSKYLTLRCNAKSSGWVKFLDAYHY
ncbi:MAG: hypothetical protein GTO24_00100 [candidate division Zixibacteria bacterium]|nr:hypothetical protein [candidate division Zixibacteria bacterium]